VRGNIRGDGPMSLITAHRILIVSAIIAFVVYGGWEVAHAGASRLALVRGAAAVAAAVGFGLYLRTVKQS